MSILVCGDAYVDVVAHGIRRLPPLGGEEIASVIEFQAGGSAGYTSAALAACGFQTLIHTIVGDDQWADFWIGSLADQGVRFVGECIPRNSTGLSLVLPLKGDRSFVTALGANLSQRRLPRRADVTLVILAGLLQAPGLWSQGVLSDISWYRSRRVPIFVDPNWSELGDGKRFLLELLEYSSILFVNDFEVCKLVGRQIDAIRAARLIGERYPHIIVVVKLGSNGALAVRKGRIVRHPGYRVHGVVNANGAGDFFLAGFSASWRSHRPISACLALGNRAGALAVSTPNFSGRLNGLRSGMGFRPKKRSRR